MGMFALFSNKENRPSSDEIAIIKAFEDQAKNPKIGWNKAFAYAIIAIRHKSIKNPQFLFSSLLKNLENQEVISINLDAMLAKLKLDNKLEVYLMITKVILECLVSAKDLKIKELSISMPGELKDAKASNSLSNMMEDFFKKLPASIQDVKLSLAANHGTELSSKAVEAVLKEEDKGVRIDFGDLITEWHRNNRELATKKNN
jgi:hypothetical protein